MCVLVVHRRFMGMVLNFCIGFAHTYPTSILGVPSASAIPRSTFDDILYYVIYDYTWTLSFT